ncbi:antibiotic biosynthesis monooxygenase [Mycolicibacterium frederiksbergense]|uniref:antibiotic biosynthesis monooxygenase n=1 Tax=Mycolicibacterium frederiksbergense TaxID=117567 RepID=UPI00265B8C66|nr:antibiotic biosynthesis monooxygenase [Mycolicibacterium frederiksbergense]MBX9919375.1 antibiotic biosynthesis monooxygenase [Mycolicibacterium frederiksbergense]MDO0977009.1 antibiotic biosynthesis monooxygenase [Mycolicibacterium frederiksbergense]
MFARSTTVMARPESVDHGIAHVRDEVMPALLELPGCIGLSLMVDRQTGRCIATSAWHDADAMADSAEAAGRLRAQAGERFGGPATAQDWEIAVLHREHSSDPGAWVRATWVTVPPELTEAGIEYYRSAVLPQIEHLPGFRSASLLVDASSGRAVSSVSFVSRDVMEHNREYASTLKAESIRAAGASGVDEGEFELVIAHLRAPELV